MPRRKKLPDIHHLYEASVQGVDTDLDFAVRLFKQQHGRAPLDLREDFCGTAALACAWVQRSPRHRAWGVDIDRATLDWGLARNAAALGPEAGQLTLLCDNVLTAATPPADLVLALNFSYCVFKTRPLLRDYFRRARRALRPGGFFVLDLYGGTEAAGTKLEPRRVPASTAADGTKIPAFRYIWDQAEYNVIDHHVINHIHFHIPGAGRIERAFTYDWRLWTLPEIQELLLEAGFQTADVYLHGWTRAGESDDRYRRRTRYANTLGWVAYIAGRK